MGFLMNIEIGASSLRLQLGDEASAAHLGGGVSPT
jgi:hypothetical protein